LLRFVLAVVTSKENKGKALHNKTINAQVEVVIINIDADCRLQIKHLSTYEKCFFYLLVDYKLNPKVKELILFRQGLKLQKLPMPIDIPMCKNFSAF